MNPHERIMEAIEVIVADDHPTMCSGLRDLLEAEADVEVIATANSGEEALRLAKRKKPNVLLLDVEMPDLSGVDVVQQLAAEESPVRVLALSAYRDRAYIRGLMESGAWGYITKEKPPHMIVEAVRAVAFGEGRWFVRPSLSRANEKEKLLSKRQREVLRFMARGHSNREIAKKLFISENTVQNHVSRIYDKLNVNSGREAVAWAWQHGLVDKF